MKSRRAALEVQFNWVFVMVAGALILVFFFGIVQKQREISNSKIADSLLTNIESIATGAAISKGTVQPVDLPNMEISFECTEECLCAYSIGDIRKDYNDKIIFSPNLIKGTQMILWTLDWNVPFRATNFIYATTRNDKYFFMTDRPQSALFKRLQEIIPPEVNAEFIDSISGIGGLGDVSNENYNSAKFILVDVTFSEPTASQVADKIDDSFSRTDVSVVYLGSNKALFYDKTNRRRLEFSMSESSYYGEPAILGAIFSADFNTYECNMISGLLRLQHILDIYIERINQLKVDDIECSIGYDEQDLIDLQEKADLAADDTTRMPGLGGSVTEIKGQNDQLLAKSCALIY